jgi:hypothetical protein
MILVHVEARGDVDGDGVEDLVLSVVNSATRGTYSYVRLTTVSRKASDSPLIAISVR